MDLSTGRGGEGSTIEPALASVQRDKARQAAETVAAYESRFSGMDVTLTKLNGDMNLLKWVVGFVLTFQIGILLQLVLA